MKKICIDCSVSSNARQIIWHTTESMLNLIPEHSRNAIKAWGGIKNRRSIWVTDELASMLLLSGIIISLANYNNQHIDFLLHVAKEDQFTKKLIDHKDDIL